MFYSTRPHVILFIALFSFINYKGSLYSQNTGSDCIEIICNKDAAIGYHDFYSVSSNNYGTAIQNAAYVIPGTQGGLNINRALMEFDISKLPANAIITNAKLSLYSTGPIGSSPGHIMPSNSAKIQNLLSQWSESQVSWDKQPLTTTNNEVILLSSTNPTQDYLDIDITNLVKDWKTIGNYGFLLKQINETASRGLLFCSSDHPNKEKYPKLEICFNLNTNVNDSKTLPSNSFDLFPNPFNNILNFSITNVKSENITIEIYAINGALVKSSTFSTSNVSLDVNDLSLGIYFAKIKSKNWVINKRILKQ